MSTYFKISALDTGNSDRIPFIRKGHMRTKCMSQLRSLWCAHHLYCEEHGGTNPASMTTIANEWPDAHLLFICPSSDNKTGTLSKVSEWSSYTYVTNAGTNPDAVLYYCPPKNHGNKGGDVVTVEGSSLLVPKDRFLQVVKQGKSALNSDADKR